MNTIVTLPKTQGPRACSSDPSHTRHRLYCIAAGLFTASGVGLSLIEPRLLAIAAFGGIGLFLSGLLSSRQSANNQRRAFQ